MGNDVTYYGSISADCISSRDGVKAVLEDYSSMSFSDQDDRNRYPEIAGWLRDDLVISVTTKDWGEWVELTLLEIAQHVVGIHLITCQGDDLEEWHLIVWNGKLFVANSTGIWKYSPRTVPRREE